LENAIEHASVLCHTSEIKVEHLPQELVNKARDSALPGQIPKDPLRRAEGQAILQVLEKHGGSRKKAAEELGISTVTLWRKLKDLGI
jgi:DNA-binding NtrC family response regulator